MKKRERWNLVLHLVVGGALAALVMVHPLWIIFDTFIYAFLREQAQHRWIHTREEIPINEYPNQTGKLFRIEKRTFFDFRWMGWKQVFEIAQWTFGSAVISIPWFYLA
jgi:hypothetical protein